MGWYYTYNASRKDLICELTKGWNKKGYSFAHVIRHCTRGNVLWTVWEVKGPGPRPVLCHIGCDLLQNSSEGWGYKPMDEGMGPYYYTCPLSYLKIAPEANAGWRQLVRKYHERKTARLRSRSRLLGRT